MATGLCWCGCGEMTSGKAFFRPYHDRQAEASILKLHYGGSVAQMLQAHGYGPEGKSLKQARTEFEKRC